ncbi:MAG: TonB-dependent receptor [Bacteroidota bacterium]
MRNLIQFKITFCLVFFLNASVIAQVAKLSGYVKDSKTQEALIGVTVKIEGTDLGAATDINGFYTIDNIPPQAYNITATYIGYELRTFYNVILRSAGNPDLNFDLNEAATQLEDVVVTASPFARTEETPLSINRLSREEIANYPGGNNDIAKVAQSLPGVGASVGGFRNDIIIRGGAPNENVYYLDGIEIPTINHFSTQGAAGGPVGLLNVSFFEGVTLSTSAFAAKYDDVLSGVLQFDQRNGNNRNFQGNVRVSSSETALTLEGPLGKKDKESSKTTVIASVRRSYLQLLFEALDLPFLPDYWDFQYKLNHKIDDYNEINFIGVGSIDDFSINVPDEIDAEDQANLDQVPIIQQWTNTTGLSWRRRFKDGSGFMRTALSTNIFNNEFTQFEDNQNQETPLFLNDSREWQNKLRYEITKFKGDRTFSGGATIQQINYETSTRDIPDNLDFSSNIDFWRYGLFGQVSEDFMNGRLSASLGIRFDGNTFTDNGNEIWRTFSPRLSASYALDEKQRWKVNASVGRYYKIPTLTMLGFRDNSGELTNRSADYIQNDHVVLGLERLISPSLKISAEGFYKRYRDYPVSTTDSVSLANLGGGFEVLGNENIESIGKGRTYGLELLLNKKFTDNIYAIVAYTLFRSEYTGFDPDNFLPSAWDSRHLFTFTGGYKLKKNWEISSRVRFLGQTPFPLLDEEATLNSYPILEFDYLTLGAQRLSRFFQLDVRFDKKWNFNKWSLNVFLEIENLTDSDIPNPPLFGLARNEQGAELSPRQIIEVEGVDNGQILPTIGIVVDF